MATTTPLASSHCLPLSPSSSPPPPSRRLPPLPPPPPCTPELNRNSIASYNYVGTTAAAMTPSSPPSSPPLRTIRDTVAPRHIQPMNYQCGDSPTEFGARVETFTSKSTPGSNNQLGMQ
eukprot:scaffold5674_cov35-Cyclotella_meneghiniana.AAC.3